MSSLRTHPVLPSFPTRRSSDLFEAKKCIHSRNCVLGRPDVFVPNVSGEWIHPDAATPADVAHLALACPSGAIRWSRDRKSTRLNSSHLGISYAVFCLQKTK